MTDQPNYDELAADIPLDLARAAHRGTSHVPETRARQERTDYADTLARDYATLAICANTDDKREALAVAFASYRKGYRDRFLARLSAMSRCMSTMITGGSNFPVSRAKKASDRADKTTQALIEYRAAALAAIRRDLTPEEAPIMSGDADAVARLAAKITAAEKAHERMKQANEAIRAHKGDANPAAATSNALVALGFTREEAIKVMLPDPMGRVGFPSYALTNSSAEIRRLKGRLEEVTRARAAQAAGPETYEGTAARYEDAPADNRVRLFYPGKPDDATRARLKSSGFRWTPSLGCWQAYRNPRAIDLAKKFAGAPKGAASEPCGCVQTLAASPEWAKAEHMHAENARKVAAGELTNLAGTMAEVVRIPHGDAPTRPIHPDDWKTGHLYNPRTGAIETHIRGDVVAAFDLAGALVDPYVDLGGEA